MDFLSLVEKRYSCRDYKQDKVEENKINLILEAARLTPTACNKFPIRINVITKEEDLAKIAETTKFNFNQPLVFICSYDKLEAWTRKWDSKNYGVVDTSLAMMQMMLEAINLDLATCFIGYFKEDKIKELFNLPLDYEVVGLLYCGYPNDKPSELHNIRKEISEFSKLD